MAMGFFSDDADESANTIISSFLRATGEDREGALALVQKLLPSWIRVYDQGGLAIYYDAWAKTPLPSWLTTPAVYIEAVEKDGSATLIKGGAGKPKLKKTTEPRVPSAWERILNSEEDDLL
jgi:hypothetical protein